MWRTSGRNALIRATFSAGESASDKYWRASRALRGKRAWASRNSWVFRIPLCSEEMSVCRYPARRPSSRVRIDRSRSLWAAFWNSPAGS